MNKLKNVLILGLMLCIGIQLKIRHQEKIDQESIAICNAQLLKRVIGGESLPFSINAKCKDLTKAQMAELDRLQIRNNLSAADFPEVSAYALLDAGKAFSKLQQKSNPIDTAVHLFAFYSWRNGSKHLVIQPMKLIPMDEKLILSFTKSSYSRDENGFTVHSKN